MKYISSRDLQTVSDALNFSTADCHLIGSCDLYTTKAAGSDKKLYKSIEHTLESQHESLVRLCASISPPQLPVDGKSKRQAPAVSMPEIDLSRESPFGPLSQIGARRTFAYFIATLNASHPDYEFSNTLRPTDFRKTSGTAIRRTVDSALHNMRPRRMMSMLAPPRIPYSSSAPLSPMAPHADVLWSEAMWDSIDKEMDMRHCEKYVWEPEDDPFEEENALWGQHYLLFNKDKKRVLYLYFQAFSVISHSPVQSAIAMRAHSMPRSISNVSVGDGAGKRAQYWLGHGVDEEDVDSSWAEDDDVAMNDGFYGGDYTDNVREQIEDGYYSYAEDDCMSDEPSGWNTRSRSVPRGHSEGCVEAMEI